MGSVFALSAPSFCTPHSESITSQAKLPITTQGWQVGPGRVCQRGERQDFRPPIRSVPSSTRPVARRLRQRKSPCLPRIIAMPSFQSPLKAGRLAAVRAEHFDQPQNWSPDFRALNLTVRGSIFALSAPSFCTVTRN
jgi:hypothetical protein